MHFCKFPVDTNAAGLSHTWRIAGVREELERGEGRRGGEIWGSG